MKKILITYAVKEEYIALTIDNCDVLSVQTGVGKTKSAYHLTRRIIEEKPDFVLNIGTAGTVSHKVGDIFIATHFIDRDYKAIKLPGIEYEISGESLIKNYPKLKSWLSTYDKIGICSTGDTFVTEIASISEDFVDMEAYTQAFVCQEMGVPFLSVKYITDIIGENSVEHWENKLADACTGLSAWFAENELLSIIVD